MKHPIFHEDERAYVSAFASDRRIINRECTIVELLTPIYGEHRYLVKVGDGIHTRVLESTLHKRFKPCDWNELGKVWQPKREAR